METEDPLSQLADIHLPAAVPFWPPAPGWWLLAAILLAAGLFLGYRYYKKWQEQQRLKRALAELEQAIQVFRQTPEDDPQQQNRQGLALLYSVNSLLKRVALVHHPLSDIASLTGQAWLSFLDDTGRSDDFSRGPGKVLAEGEYRPTFDADSEALYDCARRWIIHQYRHTQAQSPAGAAT